VGRQTHSVGGGEYMYLDGRSIDCLPRWLCCSANGERCAEDTAVVQGQVRADCSRLLQAAINRPQSQGMQERRTKARVPVPSPTQFTKYGCSHDGDWSSPAELECCQLRSPWSSSARSCPWRHSSLGSCSHCYGSPPAALAWSFRSAHAVRRAERGRRAGAVPSHAMAGQAEGEPQAQ